MGAIKSGQGALASQKILEIMGLYHTSKYQSRLLSSLLNLEDGEFKSAYAGKIASAIEKHTGVKLCKPELEHSLDFALAERYIKGKPEYLGIAENYKAKEAPKEKGRHH
jgi:TPP-dependent 2-oxoacid decarboxylase